MMNDECSKGRSSFIIRLSFTIHLLFIMKKILIPISAACALVATFCACQGGKQTEQALLAQIDSLNTTVQQQAEDLGFYQGCLSLVTDGLDSITRADSNLITITTAGEGTVTRESIREDLLTYSSMLDRLRQRSAELEQQLGQAGSDRQRMQTLINHLNQQIEKKDATIQELQKKIEQKDFSINMLQDEVNQLYALNAELTNTVQSQRKTINDTQARLYRAYYIVGTSRELKDADILSGRFLAKSKVDVDNLDLSLFTRVDTRRFQQLKVDSKSITIKSQHPSGSYEIITDKKAGTSTLRILDEPAFWSINPILIIQK